MGASEAETVHEKRDVVTGFGENEANADVAESLHSLEAPAEGDSMGRKKKSVSLEACEIMTL